VHADAISDLFHARAFALGLAFGGMGFLLSATLAATSRRRLPDFAGIAFVAAAWLGVRGAWGSDLATGSVALALIVLAFGGGMVVTITRRSAVVAGHPLLVTAIATAPGAVLLAAVSPLVSGTTSRVVLAVATICIGVGIRDFDAMNGPRGAPWLLFAVSAFGVYLAVPDTELARVMLGVSLPFILLSVPKPLCPLGPAGSSALAGLFVWVVVVGGRGRPGSVVGGLATIGILVAEPIGRRLFGSVVDRTRDRHDRNQDSWLSGALVAAFAQLVLALYTSRVVAREDAAFAAFLVLLPLLAVAVVGAPMLYPRDPPPGSRRHRSRSQSRRRSHLPHGAHPPH
jgi:hypothetical protein